MHTPTLTDERARGILAAIRAGGFPHVAAAAFGVGPRRWRRWLRRRGEPYRSFAQQVREAQAQARLRAEIAVLDEDPRTWLKHGPGRDVPGQPGWAAMVRPAPPPPSPDALLLSSPEFLQFVAKVREALAPYPEALAAVAAALAGEDVKR